VKNNYEQARARMVNEQLIPRGIFDQKVLKAMKTVPRHLFVEEALEQQAYGDFPLPIGEGQTISQPYIVALMTQALELKGNEKVLEIGTGCGYQAAILSNICEKIFTIERIKSLHKQARKLFDTLHYLNIICKLDDGTVGWVEHAPFNAIIVTASGPNVPQPLIEQLTDPGKLIMPVGTDKYSQELIVVIKNGGKTTQETIERVRFVDLVGQHGW
jgi:protein-L-isoaspartate(D-aspartate) O-methyltransferase